MKKTLYLIFCSFSICFAAMAQPQDSARIPPNLQGLKVAFVTKQLSLTTDEAQKFWPVYYSYSAELRQARKGQKDDVLAMEENMLNIRKKYKTEFKKILVSDDRVNKALTVDRDFINVVKNELQERAKARGRRKDQQ